MLPLYAHQVKALERSRDREAFALFLDMGLGKSRVAIETAAHLYELGKIDAALVVAPKGVYRNWSTVEIPKHWSFEELRPPIPLHRVFTWSAVAGQKKRASLEAGACSGGNFFVWLCMNVEAFATERGAAFAEQFLRARRALVIVDEATTIKNPNAQRTKALLRLRHLAPYRRILTGTPITKSPLDLYAPCLFLDPEVLGVRSWYAMRARYCDLKTEEIRLWDAEKRQPKFRKVQRVVGFRRVEELHARLEAHSYRATKEECLDLPPKVYLRREVELEPEQARIYGAMRDQARAELGAPGFEVKAPLVIARILRLHQIACGHLPRPDGTTERIATARLDALLEALEETDGKAIIWASYTADVHAIAETLRKAYGSREVVIYAGETLDAARPKLVEAFQSPGGPRFFVGQPRTGGYGLTLTAARTVVYYSNTFDLEVRLQSEDRAHRIGQTGSVSYLDLVTPGTVDEQILDALRGKRTLADLVLGETWREWI
jgi:SNF2 family DNA or RNA helicase